MADVVDVPDGGGPAAGDPNAAPPAGRTPEGEGEAVVDLAQVAEEFDAEALAKLSTQPGQKPVKGEGPEGGKSQAADPVEEFISKNYQGDRTAFVHSLYAGREDAKRMRERLDELERQQRSAPREPEPPADPAAEFTAARQENPEIRALDQEIQVIDSQKKDAAGTIAQIAAQAQALAGELKRLQSEQVKAEPEQKAGIAAEVAEVRAQILALDQDWKLAQAETRRLDADRRRVQREIIRAESGIRDEMAYARERAREDAADAEMAKQQFDASVAYYLGELGLDPKSEQAEYITGNCRSRLRDRIRSAGDGLGLDRAQIHAAVGQFVEETAKVFGIKPKKSSSPRGPTPRPVVVPRSPLPVVRSPGASPQSSLDGVMDNPNLSPKQKADYARKRANAVFAARARAVGRVPS
jgi:DNA repair exonuclease SbcCD ATPase subunit